MIDIHCHLLPGIDDGPAWLGESLQLALAAVDSGITHAVLTPHMHPGRYDNNRQNINQGFIELRDALNCHDIPLVLGMGAEVRICPEILSFIQQDTIPFLGKLDGYWIMLLEFPHSHIPPGSDKLVQLLLTKKVRALIAHPERNKDVMRNVEKIAPFIELGCLLQVTAGSVAGQFGKECQRTAIELLTRNWAEVLATDAHNLEHRPPDFRPGRLVAEGIIGESATWDLVYVNPLAIVATQFNTIQNNVTLDIQKPVSLQI